MATEAKRAKFRREMAKLEASKRQAEKVKAQGAVPEGEKPVLQPRDRIRIRLRCRLCGRPRAVYRKFGICRICFRDMASNGLIPGVMKASW